MFPCTVDIYNVVPRYDVHTLHYGNLYQIFTYVKNKDTEFGDQPHKVSGMLLYAATDEAIQPDNSYQMSGNKISVKTLDLNKDFPEIAAQLMLSWMTILVDLFPWTLTIRRYVSLNAHGCLTCSLERLWHIGHGYESFEACGVRVIDDEM